MIAFFNQMSGASSPSSPLTPSAGMMVLQLIWVATQVVETKGVPLEQIAERLGVRSDPGS